MSHYQPITTEEFRDALPVHVRKNVNEQIVDQINAAITDPEALAVFRENVIGLTSVMREGRFKIVDYLYAVKYVSHKLLGDPNITAWQKTFPDRYKRLIANGTTRNEITAISSRYNGSKLVTLMMAQTLVPTHILNAPLYQEAINTQAELMRTANSEKVRCEAAKSLMDTLKPPEEKKIELEIGIQEDAGMKELRAETMRLARLQREAIERGELTAQTVAEAKLIGSSSTADEAVNE